MLGIGARHDHQIYRSSPHQRATGACDNVLIIHDSGWERCKAFNVTCPKCRLSSDKRPSHTVSAAQFYLAANPRNRTQVTFGLMAPVRKKRISPFTFT